MNKILLIEDDLALTKLYRVALESKGFQVEEAHDGTEGMQKIAGGGYDLVVLDLMLPGINGFDILKDLRKAEATKNLPVVVLTNLTGPEVNNLPALGISDLVLKAAVTPAEFTERVEKVFASAPNF